MVRLGLHAAAQVGYPHVAGSAEARQFPAQFIAEAIDQTRGWFYTLLAVNTLVFGAQPYEHVLCLGHIVDENGKKMSKSLGNVIDRGRCSTPGRRRAALVHVLQGSPWTSTRASLGAIDESLRESLATLWNTFSFFTMYARSTSSTRRSGDSAPSPSAALRPLDSRALEPSTGR